MAELVNIPEDTHKVLIVDDRPQNLMALAKLLKPLELTVIKANSGNEALAMTIEHDFSLVLLDVKMPGMDGFETADLMRHNEKTKHIPIIFVTAIDPEDSTLFEDYAQGTVDFLSKPIDAEILRGKVHAFLDSDNKNGGDQ